MTIEYSKQRLCDNIDYSLKEGNVKLGEIEIEAGKTQGYYSRIKRRNEKSEPSLKFLYILCRKVGIPMEMMIQSDNLDFTNGSKQINELLQKLIANTISRNIDWNVDKLRKTSSFLSRIRLTDEEMEAINSHPEEDLMGHVMSNATPNDYYHHSYTYGRDTKDCEDCFYAQVTNGLEVTVLKVINDKTKEEAIEMWIRSGGRWEIACNDKGEQFTSLLVKDLYKKINKYINDDTIHISSELKEALDSYLAE